MIQLDDIRRVRSQFDRDSEGCYWSGEFVSLLGDLILASSGVADDRLTSIYEEHRHAEQDLRSLVTILFKLEWIRSRLGTDDRSQFLWYQFAPADIDHFHVQLRSIFDHAKDIIKQAADKPRQVRADSFTGLQNWLKKNPGNRVRLGEVLSSLVESADWFPRIQQLRNFIIHSGGFTLVFFDLKEGIHFQCYGKSLQPFIRNQSVMYNENVVDFQLYSAFFLCKLILFLEGLAKAVRSRFNIAKRGSESKMYCEGFPHLLRWLDKLAAKMQS